MKLSHQFYLQNNNSFNVEAVTPTIYFPESVSDLESLPDFGKQPFYILGDGSNTLFVEQNAPIIIKPNFHGISITETAEFHIVKAGAAENWHDLVCLCIEKEIYGLENLALIPGSVGAAPVQNIGAYGLELSDFCTEINWFEFSTKKIITLNNEQCRFSYRDSVFKQELYNKGVITDVVLKLPKAWQANLSYAGISELDENCSAKQVMEQVISLRENKLPNPAVLPNAGSFFKNPIISEAQLIELQDKYPDLPYYKQQNGLVKLAAGWLIEKTGLKGFSEKGVGVHEKQALVIVNYSSDKGIDIVMLAKQIQQKVLSQFSVKISPEVRMITINGERDFDELPTKIESN